MNYARVHQNPVKLHFYFQRARVIVHPIRRIYPGRQRTRIATYLSPPQSIRLDLSQSLHIQGGSTECYQHFEVADPTDDPPWRPECPNCRVKDDSRMLSSSNRTKLTWPCWSWFREVDTVLDVVIGVWKQLQPVMLKTLMVFLYISSAFRQLPVVASHVHRDQLAWSSFKIRVRQMS